MNILVEQECPQCGGKELSSESDRLFRCSYCGVSNFIQTKGIFRYFIPPRHQAEEENPYLLVPYIRFKGTVFVISSQGVEHKVIDTTQAAVSLPELPPSLGVQPQAMKMQRVASAFDHRYILRDIAPEAILKKVIRIADLVGEKTIVFHTAYIGESVSIIYLPLFEEQGEIRDGVSGQGICQASALNKKTVIKKAHRFHQQWQVQFLPTLCPHCGWDLHGESDSLVLHCENCYRGWELDNQGIHEKGWKFVPKTADTLFFLPFWQVHEGIDLFHIRSFADFMTYTNQPVVVKPEWHQDKMTWMVPAFKVKPKAFLRAGKQATIGQHRLHMMCGKSQKNIYPVTLSAAEGVQAVKSIFAASATSPRRVHPFLPEIRIKGDNLKLVYLPFVDKGHDWVQPHSGITIGKNILRFGRSM